MVSIRIIKRIISRVIVAIDVRILIFATILDNEDLQWLATHLEPWEEVTDKWTNSFGVRRKLLLESDISVCDYIDKFLCLKVQEGKELVNCIHYLFF